MTVTSNPLRALPAWSVQLRVIAALVMREVHTRYGRENIGFLWIFVKPVLFIDAVTGVRGLFEMGIVRGGVDIAAILFTGYPPMVMWRTAILRNIASLRQNAPLMFHRQVRPFDIVLSRILLESAAT